MREVLVEVGRHCGYRSGGSSTPRQRRGAGSRRLHACTGGRGIFGGALFGRHADAQPVQDHPRPARSRELPPSISKANDIPGAKRGANGGRRQVTPRDVWRRRVQLPGSSGHAGRRPATVKLRLKRGAAGSNPATPTRSNTTLASRQGPPGANRGAMSQAGPRLTLDERTDGFVH